MGSYGAYTGKILILSTKYLFYRLFLTVILFIIKLQQYLIAYQAAAIRGGQAQGILKFGATTKDTVRYGRSHRKSRALARSPAADLFSCRSTLEDSVGIFGRAELFPLPLTRLPQKGQCFHGSLESCGPAGSSVPFSKQGNSPANSLVFPQKLHARFQK